ncbi:MAG: hypothetical protein V7603_4529 [Micromonosporaceae bacterium]
MDPRAVLTALADLAPAGGERILDVTRGGQSLAWLTRPDTAPRAKAFDRLAALDALHREERLHPRSARWSRRYASWRRPARPASGC